MKIEQATCQAEIEAIIDFRDKILRQPWGQPRETATDNLEASSINAYIKNEQGIIVACGRLQENTNTIGQIRFMAVDTLVQRKGLGKKIIDHLETEARALNLKKMELQARENAVDFYKIMGYSIKEKTFLLWGQIQHYLMVKDL